MLTVDVRIQDQIILIIAHLKRERRGTNVSETIYSIITQGYIAKVFNRRSTGSLLKQLLVTEQ